MFSEIFFFVYFRKGQVNPKFPYLLHLGIQVLLSLQTVWSKDCCAHSMIMFFILQCYDAKFLDVYAQLPSSSLQLEEDLEQLKVLENGYKMKVISIWYFFVFSHQIVNGIFVNFCRAYLRMNNCIDNCYRRRTIFNYHTINYGDNCRKQYETWRTNTDNYMGMNSNLMLWTFYC